MIDYNLLAKVDSDPEYTQATDQMVKEQKDSLENLLRENLKYNRAIYADTQKIRRYMFWRMVMSIVWLVLVIAPIIVALFYLPPVLSDFYQGYKEAISGGQGSLDLLQQLNNLK